MHSYLDIRTKKGRAEELNRRYRAYFRLPATSFLVFDAEIISREIERLKSDQSCAFFHLGKYINSQKDWAVVFPERSVGYGQIEISGFEFHDSPAEKRAACSALIDFLLVNDDLIEQIKNLDFARYIGLIGAPIKTPKSLTTKGRKHDACQVSLF